MAALILLAVLLLAGIASMLGYTADSRDPDYGIGPMLKVRGRAAHDR